jgi:hypothetical protein
VIFVVNSENASQEGKKFQFRDTHILLAGVRRYAPDPISGTLEENP